MVAALERPASAPARAHMSSPRTPHVRHGMAEPDVDGSRTELMSPVSPVGSDTRAAALSPLYCGSSAGRARLVQTRRGWERRTFPHQTNTPSREIRKHGAKQDEESQF